MIFPRIYVRILRCSMRNPTHALCLFHRLALCLCNLARSNHTHTQPKTPNPKIKTAMPSHVTCHMCVHCKSRLSLRISLRLRYNTRAQIVDPYQRQPCMAPRITMVYMINRNIVLSHTYYSASQPRIRASRQVRFVTSCRVSGSVRTRHA